MKKGIDFKEITLIMEISDTKLNNFHGLKVTSNAQKNKYNWF
jgi:hypothetical protein